MAEAVIDALESVQIQQQHGKGSLLADHADPGLLELLHQQATVHHAGQFVRGGLPVELQQHVELAALHPGTRHGEQPQQPDLIEGLHAQERLTHQQPVAGQHGDQDAACQLQTERERDGEDGKQADEQIGERHVTRLQLLIRPEAVQTDEGEEHHHRHQVAQRQLHALALEVDEIGEGNQGREGQQAEDPDLKQFVKLGGGQGQPIHQRPGGQPHHQQAGEQAQTHRHKAHAGQGEIFGVGTGTPELRQLQHPEPPFYN
ncbi:hypothetical protein D3C72_895350 [compost metagenome]